MKTLYKNSRYIAAAIVGTMVLSASGALALTHDTPCETPTVSMTQVEDMGRFVVTPQKVTYVRPAEDLGRFIVSRHGAVFVPAA